MLVGSMSNAARWNFYVSSQLPWIPRSAPSKQLSDQLTDFDWAARLLEKIHSTQLHGLDSRRDGPMSRDHDHTHFGPSLFDPTQHLHAAYAW